MTRFRYIGDKPRGDCLGYKFPRNISTEVENPIHVKKLDGNPHFQRVDSTGKPGRPRAAVPVSGGEQPASNNDQQGAGGDGNEGADQVAGAE
jgi:hypothetical protein